MRVIAIHLALCLCLLPARAFAQFSVIIDAPPTVIGDNQTIGSGTQLNVSAGGVVGSNFAAGAVGVVSTNIEVNIGGGTVGHSFSAYSGSVVHISGGAISSAFAAEEGSVVNVTGGAIENNFGVWGGTANVSGGTIEGFYLWPGGIANISGGNVGTGVYGFNANNNTLLNISGGQVNGGVAYSGSEVNISGGVIADELDVRSGSATTLIGGEFRLNGALVAGLTNPGDTMAINLPVGAILNGTFADGTPFVFASDDGDSIAANSLTLRAATLPAVGPTQLNIPTDAAPLGIRDGQTLALGAGGALGGNFQAGHGSTLNVSDGTIGQNLEAVAATVNVSGGNIGRYFDAFAGTVVNVNGGTIQRNANAFAGSMFHISGGTVEDFFIAHAGSLVQVTGGTVGGPFSSSLQALAGSTIEISGGTISNGFEVSGDVAISGGVAHGVNVLSGGDVSITNGTVNTMDVRSGGAVDVHDGVFGRARTYSGGTMSVRGGSWADNFDADAGSVVHMHGGEFLLDGVPISGLETIGNTTIVNVPTGSVLSGTLADGTPIAYSSQNSDTFANGTLTLLAAALPSAGPPTFNVPTDAAPPGLRTGQSLNLTTGGQLGENFTAGWGTTVTISGGSVGKNFEAVGANVTITAGSVAAGFDAFRGSTVQISGGTVSSLFAQAGSNVHVSGGTLGLLFVQGGVANLAGGNVGSGLQVNDSGILSVSGGTIANNAVVNSGGVANISGGTIGNAFRAASGSVVNLRHGSIGNSVDVQANAVFNMYGGTVGTDFDADALSNVTLFGTQFVLNGVNITSTLPYNTPTVISNRNVSLTGILSDATAFAFDLYSTDASNRDYFATGAVLRLTRVLPGDFNLDGAVTAADYVAYRHGLGTLYSPADYQLWRANFGLQAIPALAAHLPEFTPVPEPGIAALGVALTIATACRRRQRRSSRL